MTALQVLGILAVTTVVGGLVAFGLWTAKKRREALAALADSLGLRFHRADDRSFDDYHTHAVFHQGRSRAAYNRMEGALDVAGSVFAITMGDYRYTVRTGKNSTTFRFSFLLIRPSWGPLPNFELRPEHWGDKIMGAIGFDDIDFESEEFSRKFMVQSPDKRFAYAVIHPRMMEYLLEVKGPKIDIRDGECLLMTGISTWDADRFREHVAWAKRFFGLWPEHLTRQLGGGDHPEEQA